MTGLSLLTPVRFALAILAVIAISANLPAQQPAPAKTPPVAAKPLRGFKIRVSSQASGEELNQQTDLWVLEVRFKPLRLISVNLTDPKTGKKTKQLVWYLVYRAVNRPLPFKGDPNGVNPQNVFDPTPGEPLFAPEFTLITNDNDSQKIYSDDILPEAQAAIAARERLPQLKNSVQVVGPVPKATPVDAKQDNAPIYGVVTWKGIDARTDFVTIYMSGFSNGYRHVRGPVPFNTLSQALAQGQLRRTTALWNGDTTQNWTNMHDLLETSKTNLLKKQAIEAANWFFVVKPSASGPPAGSILWRKTLVQRYWRPGDAIDQDEAEFFTKGPNDEVFEPRWIYRPEAAPLASRATKPATKPAAKPASQTSPAETAARDLLADLIAGRFTKAAMTFSPEVLKALPADKLKALWQTLQAQAGAYQSVDKSATVKTVQANQVVDLLCTFEKTPLILRVAFNNKKQVAGFFFLPPPKPKPATPKAPGADSPKPTPN